MSHNIEKKIINRLISHDFEGFDVSDLNLNLDETEEIIVDVEMVREEDDPNFVLLYHGDEGSVGTFDMLTKVQQKKICDYVERKLNR